MNTVKKTLVLGASANPSRYSYLAIKKLRQNNIPVIGIGKKNAQAGDVNIATALPDVKDVHTVTLYLNRDNQKAYYNYILALHPQRIIFNPGAENEELQKLAAKNGIETMNACTLVLLATGQY